MSNIKIRIGLVINPFAGVGGPSAYKGSDGEEIRQRAIAGEISLVAVDRAKHFLTKLNELLPDPQNLTVVTVPGLMGGDITSSFPFKCELLPFEFPYESLAQHTCEAVRALQTCNIDLCVFVGGDGTARDVCSSVKNSQAVLGVPSGVKMHSSVFAITPYAAAELITHWSKEGMVDVQMQEVRDIDEQAFRRGIVRSRHFGEMLTPKTSQFMQHVKQGGFEVEELVLLDIADDLRERFTENTLLVWGAGSTTYHIAKHWGLETTLLGVDILIDQEVVATDVNTESLMHQISEFRGDVYVVVTAIGGQGHIIGRGNQQISANLLKKIGRSHLIVVATKTKLQSLEGRPLIIDSGDPKLDQDWKGQIPVICGYQHQVLYLVGYS